MYIVGGFSLASYPLDIVWGGEYVGGKCRASKLLALFTMALVKSPKTIFYREFNAAAEAFAHQYFFHDFIVPFVSASSNRRLIPAT